MDENGKSQNLFPFSLNCILTEYTKFIQEENPMEQSTAEPTLLNQLGTRIIRLKEIGALIGLIVIIFIFSILSNKFLQWGNINGILTMTAELGLVAVGVCMLMIAGEFDLSVGSVYAVVPMVGALLANIGVPYFFAFILALL